MDSGWFVVIGTAIGGLISIVPVVVQAKAQARADRLKQATDLAIADHQARIELAKSSRGGVTIHIPPIGGSVCFHVRLLEQLAKGVVDVASYQRLISETSALYPRVPADKAAP